MKTFRVWMNDGYCSIQSAETREAAEQEAVSQAIASCKGCAMSGRDRHEATTVKSSVELDDGIEAANG